jgi:hypothetical protein
LSCGAEAPAGAGGGGTLPCGGVPAGEVLSCGAAAPAVAFCETPDCGAVAFAGAAAEPGEALSCGAAAPDGTGCCAAPVGCGASVLSGGCAACWGTPGVAPRPAPTSGAALCTSGRPGAGVSLGIAGDGSTGCACWAKAGAASSASVNERRRIKRAEPAKRIRRPPSAVGGAPAPGAGAVAAPLHPLAIDLRDHVAVAGEQRLGGAHVGAERQLALGQAVGAVLDVFRRGAVLLRPAGAIGALVHLAAPAEIADARYCGAPKGQA